MKADAKDSWSDLTIKDISNDSVESYLAGDRTVDISAVFDLLKEIFDHVQCLQRAIVVMCEGDRDFKAEYAEDMAELKRAVHELRRNKVWIPRESV
jgi:hypothetical protein